MVTQRHHTKVAMAYLLGLGTGRLLGIVLLRPVADPPVEAATVATVAMVDMGDRGYPFIARRLKLE